MILRLAEYDFDQINQFLELAKEAQESRLDSLKQLANSGKMDGLEDWLVDHFAELDDFAAITSEFAVLGLWRSVELYRKRAILSGVSKKAAGNVFKNKEFKKQLLKIGIREDKLSCARSVDELRCLNNAIKHERRVGEELCGLRRWQKKKARIWETYTFTTRDCDLLQASIFTTSRNG
jgi:hypothetical protein